MTKIGDAKRKLHGIITGRPDNFPGLLKINLQEVPFLHQKMKSNGCKNKALNPLSP